MKYILLVSLLYLTSCSNSDKETESRNKREAEMLTHVEKKQEEVPSTEPAAPEEPAKPTCEDIVFQEIYVDGKLLDTCRESERETCGVVATRCSNEVQYYCLHNVKIKFNTREVCE